MVYTGTVQNGVVVLDNGASLADGTLVKVELIPQDGKESESGSSLFAIGRRAIRTGQPDLATNVDHYLYGHPKARDNEG
jgi:hypothetical protein